MVLGKWGLFKFMSHRRLSIVNTLIAIEYVDGQKFWFTQIDSWDVCVWSTHTQKKKKIFNKIANLVKL